MRTGTTVAGDGLLVELTYDHYHRILKYANEASPVYFRLKNSITTESGTILVPCNVLDAEMILGVAKHFCPAAVSKIDVMLSSNDTVPSSRIGTRHRSDIRDSSKIKH